MRKYARLVFAGIVFLAALAGPGTAAHAGTVGGGGCANGGGGGVNIRSCISYRASGPALYGDAYLTSLGGRGCVRISKWFIVNGTWHDTGSSQTKRTTGYVDAVHRKVTVISATQSARAVMRLYDCNTGAHLGDAASLEQRW